MIQLEIILMAVLFVLGALVHASHFTGSIGAILMILALVRIMAICFLWVFTVDINGGARHG